VRGHITGARDEAVLMPARPRLMAERLLWLGLGEREGLDAARFRSVVSSTLSRLVGLKIRSAALVLPGRAQDRMQAALAMELLLEESQPYAEQLDELTVLDTAEAQRAMLPFVDRARRRALAEL
jgi:hypothetical protein